MQSSPFFRPSPDWVGDVIPYMDGDTLRLYYLRESRTSPKPGTPWALATTQDLTTFEDRGVALVGGGPDAADFNAYTGSIVRDDDGLHHLFYTGQNPALTGEDGRPLQVVMHATSPDLEAWTKLPDDTFGASEGYETSDWRDPFVYRTSPDGPWQMILAARHDHGPSRRRGLIARLTSTDLCRWEPTTPLWDPHQAIAHECPEIFRLGDWWYLVHSEFSDSFVTRYRMSRSPEGPWISPALDTLDGRSFYAAKSADVHGRRVFIGWIASRAGDTDDGPWQWAGTMSLLEAVPREDGTLDFGIPDETFSAFPEPGPISLTPCVTAPDGYACDVGEHELPRRAHVRVELEATPDTSGYGLLLRCSGDGENGYALRIEPRRRRMVLDRWPRPTTGTEQWQISGDVPHAIELERPLDLPDHDDRPHTLDVLMWDDILVVSFDRRVCLSTRIHDHVSGRLGAFVTDGSLRLHRLDLHHAPDQHA
ncbi:glycoside hydrolase [Brachybacterium huguangmaarense]|uniref:beta-fructofuranosidase n=1 Tax=Brachybacterium huguangmaarense TaxID=1652028 RepID=A0ABY6G582_9MICO|nr:glycoside hydrolase [Brachybacterium huguangmaarense]UYG17809.1 glycoside hydrolase [Brachybacterium huguangmaarense]